MNRADLYRMLHRGNEGDVEFYVDLCRKAHNVLELGSGYGRLLEPLARVAGRVVGLELDADLRALAAERLDAMLEPKLRERVELREGDMRHFEFEERFDRILLPYNGLFCVLDDGEVQRLFETVARHLTAGGYFIFDVYAADLLFEDAREIPPGAAVEDEAELLAEFISDEGHIEVYESSVWTPDAQRYDVTYEHIVETEDDILTVSYTIEQRYRSLTQLEALLDAAGLDVIGLVGDFDGEFDTDEHEQVAVIARLASEEERV